MMKAADIRSAQSQLESEEEVLNRWFGAAEEKEKEDSYEDDEDDEQDISAALSLLETARDCMIMMAKFLDCRNLSLAAEQDHFVTTTIMDIKQFLAAFEKEDEVSCGELLAETKMVVMGPVAKTHTISYRCAHQKHATCDLIRCDCVCHDDEKVEKRRKK